MFKALFGSSSSTNNRRSGGSSAGGKNRSKMISSSSSSSLAPNRVVEVQLRLWGKWHRAEVLRVAPGDLPPTEMAAANTSPQGADNSPNDDVIIPTGDVSSRFDGTEVATALFPGSPTLSPSQQPNKSEEEVRDAGGKGGDGDSANEEENGPADENDAAGGGQRLPASSTAAAAVPPPLHASTTTRAKGSGSGVSPAFSRTAARVSARKASKAMAASAQW
jgi:hypothetical protein